MRGPEGHGGYGERRRWRRAPLGGERVGSRGGKDEWSKGEDQGLHGDVQGLQGVEGQLSKQEVAGMRRPRVGHARSSSWQGGRRQEGVIRWAGLPGKVQVGFSLSLSAFYLLFLFSIFCILFLI